MHSAVDIDNLTIKIGKQAIIKNFSVRLPDGRIIGLLGPSGAGKTTLIKSIVGRRRVRGGSISIFGLPPGDLELRKSVGYMPQTPSLYLDLTARENIRYFASIGGLDKAVADKALEDVGLEEHADIAAAKLSGGQKSRASLAIAWLGQPRLLVLDEPTVGVDPMLRQELWQRFRQLADGGTTIIVTSHVMDEAERCDYLMLIRNGRLLAFDEPARLKHHTHTRTVEQTFLKLEGAQ